MAETTTATPAAGPKRYSPTQLSKFLDNCPAALAFYREAKLEQRFEVDADGSGPAKIGIAFHACMHQAALAEKAEKGRIPAVEATALTMSKLMPAEWAREGADLCLDFIQGWEFITKLDFEHGIAFDAKWRRLDWDDEKARVRCIFDAVGVLKFDDPDWGELRTAYSQDYKTGWGVCEDDLNGVQALMYTTALLKLYGEEIDAIKIELVAVRFGRRYSRTWVLENEEDAADLIRRQQRLEFYMNAADASDLKPSIGYGCSRCEYADKCQAFQDRLKGARDSRVFKDPVEAAKDLVVLETRAKEISSTLKEATKSSGPITVGEHVLGHHPTTKREVKDPGGLLDLWFKCAGNKDDEAIQVGRGMMVAGEIGATAMDKIIGSLAKKLGYKSKKAAVEAESPKFTEDVQRMEFRWKKKVAE